MGESKSGPCVALVCYIAGLDLYRDSCRIYSYIIAGYELAPSHAGLEAILDEFPDNWNQLSIAMGVSIGSVGAGRTDYESKLKALQKWVDGKIDQPDIHPGTWRYFLDTVREKLGRRPAEKFERKLDQKFEAWSCKLQ